RVTDIDGKSYIDCTAQAWTLALGYNHPEVTEAALAQMQALPHVRAGFPTLPRLQLAKRLAEICPGRLMEPDENRGALRPGREVHAVHAELRPGAEPVLLPLLAARPARSRRPV